MPFRTVPALLKRAQRLGLSHEVAVHYVDDHARLFGHHRFNTVLATPDDWSWRRLRARLQRAWCAVRSQDGWWTYVASPERRQFREELDGVWAVFAPRDDDEVPHPHRQRMAKAGSWEGLWNVIEGHAWPQSRLFSPGGLDDRGLHHGGRPAAEARLQQVLQACGLRGISWPWEQPDTPVHLLRIADVLEESQRLLQARTGLTGPVLGLGGRLHLSLDAHLPLHGAQAFFSWRRQTLRRGSSRLTSPLAGGSGGRVTRLIMVVSLRSGMTALAHEWFHALDGLLAMSAGGSGGEGVSEQWTRDQPFTTETRNPAVRQAVDGMNRFVDGFVEGPMPEERFQGAAQEAVQRWVDQFRAEGDPPHYLALLAREEQELQQGRWDEGVAKARWEDALRHRLQQMGSTPDETSEEFRYGVVHRLAMARLHQRLVSDGTLPHRDGLPFWTAAQDFITEVETEHGLETWRGYTRRPHEMLAHAFESSFDRPDLLIVETRSGMGTLRFPTGVEAAYHAPGWAQMFDSLQPWWGEICQTWERAAQESTGRA